MMCQCDNCGHRCHDSQLNESTDLELRLDYPIGHPKCIEPEGDCPKCGAFSYAIQATANAN